VASRRAGAGRSFVVTGVRELDRALRELPLKLGKKVIRQAIRQALRPVKAAVEANAPVDTGKLRSKVKVRAGKGKRGTIRLVVRIGEGDFAGQTFYAAMVEYGTSKQPGQHYMLRAFESTRIQARDEAIRLILEGVEREARALNST